jgi:hypothetical protein
MGGDMAVTDPGTYPFAVLVEDPVWVTLADGCRIAGTIWRPEAAAPVPVVVEMVPYRRRDGTVLRDMEMAPYTAGHGVAVVRFDIRGSGDSDGLLADEYTVQEQLDAVELIAWAARQPWSNGRVGMTGISWGGFNALQVAARRPPGLGAIIALCASDDRYSDDIHFMGGALLTEEEMWSNFMAVKQAMAPDPQIVGTRWREMWRARLEGVSSLSETWLAHQRRDSYWRQGSVIEDYAAIACPVMAVAGWEDSYSNFVPRLLAGLRVPRLGIVGPWSHTYPCRGSPGPNIGYLQEALRWWKHWLADEPTGIMNEPVYRVWIGGAERPKATYHPAHEGSWAAEESWPSPRIRPSVLHLNGRGLLEASPASGPERSVRSPATAGTDCGRWGGYGGTTPDMAIDQRREDGQGLTFETLPLEEDTIILGAVELDLEIAVDESHVNLTARLCDVFPDGASALVTYGVLNLSHRDSHEHPVPCPVDQPFRVRLRLNDVGRLFAKGHRIRIGLATQHWPIVWPQPRLATLTLASGRSTLTLPVRRPSELDGCVRFEPPETAPPVPSSVLRPGGDSRIHEDDLATGIRRITLRSDHGRTRIEDRGIETDSAVTDRFEIHPDDPLSARLVTEYSWALRSGEADTEVSARTILTADAEHFHLDWQVEAREGGRLVHEAGHRRRIRRDFA